MTTPKFKNFNIEPYKPGKSKIKKLKKIIKLSANESALGMSSIELIPKADSFADNLIIFFNFLILDLPGL